MTRDELLKKICPWGTCDCGNDYESCNCDDCNRVLEEWLYDYEKHVIEQYKADTNLKDTIKEIHDNVAWEMYCEGIDDLTEKLKEMANNSSTKYIRLSEKETITTYGVEQIAEQLKAGGKE
ncbi:MAG: hypothetical protein SPF36_07945 [Lachnospiraceae bacterium]|nr:hypothetical protein [Lachnospiraceae bacterium]